LGRDFFFSSDILRALHEHTRWDFYFGSFRGRRHDGRNGRGQCEAAEVSVAYGLGCLVDDE
jgi:hypothetical protein